MLDVLQTPDDIEILPVRKLEARVAGVFAAYGKDFVTEAVDVLSLGFDGIERDVHSGIARRSGSREPWYPRGTEMHNERQLSIVASDELAIVAGRMGIAELKPEWIGANLVIDGVPRLSMLPSGTLLFFANGATVKTDAQNGPCRFSGESIARNAGMEDITAGALLFPKVAKRLRGLVAWVEKPGAIRPGEAVSVRVPEQWIYSV
jgi:MOSC domain-containing protein